jgi:hypothetical protein
MQDELNALTRVFPDKTFKLEKFEDTAYVSTEVGDKTWFMWKQPGIFLFISLNKGETLPDFDPLIGVDNLHVFHTMMSLVSFLKTKI